MILLINACVREESRTKRLAECLLEDTREPIERIDLEKIPFPVTDGAFLKKRDALIAEGKTDDALFTLARQFASADRIVIAAPYWDLSFPASLKQYFEQINVTGITFAYTEDGVPYGLCRAERLDYVTTAGGQNVPFQFGYEYARALAQGFYGIEDVRLWQAQGLDLFGADAEGILSSAMETVAASRTEERG